MPLSPGSESRRLMPLAGERSSRLSSLWMKRFLPIAGIVVLVVHLIRGDFEALAFIIGGALLLGLLAGLIQPLREWLGLDRKD